MGGDTAPWSTESEDTTEKLSFAQHVVLVRWKHLILVESSVNLRDGAVC